MRPDELTKAEAQRRVYSALDRIQRAQEELGRANADLSNLLGGGAPKLSDNAGKVYDQVHALWYAVAELRGDERVDLDDIAGPAFLERQKGGAT